MSAENPADGSSAATGRSHECHTLPFPSARPRVILIAEDNALFRRLVVTLMRWEGYSVLSVADGHQGLELSRHYPGTIDLLITDVQMPRINGVELCDRLFQDRPGIKVIFLTGACMSEFAALDASVPVLTKPIDAGFLIRKVRAILAAPVDPALEFVRSVRLG